VLLQHLEPNANDDNSAVTFFFQVPSRALNDTVLLEVLADAFEQGFYNTLRTQEQLGYIVYSGIRSKEGVYSLSLTVQSNVLDGPGLTRRVESYLAEAVDQLTTLSSDEFESFKEGLRVRKLEPDQRLTSQAMRLWSEVVNKDIEPPMFDRYAREVDLLKNMTQAQFSQFARELLGPQGARRRLLVSEINSQLPTPSSTKQSKSKKVAASGAAPLKLVDELAFRSQSPRI
jgi:insulysin